MKKISVLDTFIVAAVLFSIHNTALASYTLNLVDHIETEPNYPAKSKPFYSRSNLLSSSYIKLASVRFVTDNSRMVNFNCPEGWEYKNGWCRVAACEGYPYSDVAQTANCASVGECLSGSVMKYKCNACKTNLTSDGSGGCYCDASVYKYNVVSNPCSYKYDESKACTYVNASGASSTSYADCLCSPEWVQCLSSFHHVGVGTACISGGKEYYNTCKCTDNYDKTCANIGIVNPGDYCSNPQDGLRYYQECYTCDSNKNEIYEDDYNNYWCGLGWKEFEAIPGINSDYGEQP